MHDATWPVWEVDPIKMYPVTDQPKRFIKWCYFIKKAWTVNDICLPKAALQIVLNPFLLCQIVVQWWPLANHFSTVCTVCAAQLNEVRSISIWYVYLWRGRQVVTHTHNIYSFNKCDEYWWLTLLLPWLLLQLRLRRRITHDIEVAIAQNTFECNGNYCNWDHVHGPHSCMHWVCVCMCYAYMHVYMFVYIFRWLDVIWWLAMPDGNAHSICK